MPTDAYRYEVRFLVLVVVACSSSDVDMGPDAGMGSSVIFPDAQYPDDGFGLMCYFDERPDGDLVSRCKSAEGLPGICSGSNICRRVCTDTGYCPAGQYHVPVQGGECICEPVQCLAGWVDAAEARQSGGLQSEILCQPHDWHRR